MSTDLSQFHLCLPSIGLFFQDPGGFRTAQVVCSLSDLQASSSFPKLATSTGSRYHTCLVKLAKTKGLRLSS
ncbi:hypothetical protein PGT21_012410 [Puccinia graminis f. sp. tritici]|uniref:Uncharacterized protein n=1 Tax=Puccinia graminis f. sp. tritici TaxID=56615 RepID=A0A5B0MCJ1_PUCGR|nr:hypothetical protein PGT21_012410 [Puccinia graminis f. sp. tritici]